MPKAPGAAALAGGRVAVELEDVAEGEFVEERDKVEWEEALAVKLVAEEEMSKDGEIEVLGRVDESLIRGCNLDYFMAAINSFFNYP